MNDYETLPEAVHPKGTGIPNLTAKLIRRKGNICLYERSDDVWEVFFVNVCPAGMLYDKFYPERETYPGNEDFGNSAWCFNNRALAERKYDKLNRV